jgi:SAM-dependent methyltransferase
MIEPLDVLREMAKNLIMGNTAIAHLRERLGGGRTTGFLDVPAALEHTRTIFSRYQGGLAGIGLDESWWQGKRTLEIGPGATLGVQLLQVAAGVSKADAIDRFPDVQFTRQSAQFYETLLAGLPDSQRALCGNEYRTSAGLPVFTCDRIGYHADCPLETVDRRVPRSYDIALAHFALEHVTDLGAGIAALSRVLKPGGLCVFICHLVSLGGVHNHETEPLRLLYYSDTVWHLMFGNRGGSNRVRASGYRQVLQAHNFKILSFDILERLPVDQLTPVKARFNRRFTDLEDEDLSILKFRLVGRLTSDSPGCEGS